MNWIIGLALAALAIRLSSRKQTPHIHYQENDNGERYRGALTEAMPKLLIHYRDSNGDLSERIISDYRPVSKNHIDAHCHVRNACRTFKLMNIICAADPETGEIIQNIWKFFGMEKAADGREQLFSLTSSHLTTIKALRLFAITALGFSKANRARERGHIVRFIKHNTNVESYSDAEIDKWLKELWCGDMYAYQNGETAEYEALLRAIPTEQKPAALNTAFAIVAGSGRRPIAQEIAERINNEYG